ncbi:MAG TPA: metallophosphoesterase [Polyangiaceae bacterium]
MSGTRLILFLVIVGGLDVSLHYYLWGRLVRDAELSERGRLLGTVFFVLVASLVLVRFVTFRVAGMEGALASALSWVTYIWLGCLFYLFWLTLAGDVVRLVMRIGLGKPDEERRRTIGRLFAGGVVGAGGLLGLASLFGGLREVAIKRVRVSLAKLPKGMSGTKIVQLTDVHVGPTIHKAFIDDLVAKANAEKPDVVAITGDLVDGSVESLAEHVAGLAKLEAKHGVFFVTGNHEYYSGVDEWIAHLTTLGIKVLRNQRVPIGGDAGFDLAGVDDAHAASYGHGHAMSVKSALWGRDEARAVVLLAHQPKAIFDAKKGNVDLQLSGHTHGGQLFPWNFFVKLDQPYVEGLFDHDGTQIYVSPGTGYWGPPMRLGTRAEITVIELVTTS